MSDIGATEVTIPTYGNVWQAPRNHLLQLEITNLDSPYLSPSRIPSAITISNVRLEVPVSGKAAEGSRTPRRCRAIQVASRCREVLELLPSAALCLPRL